MKKKEFEQSLREHAATIEEIRQTAWDLHRSVGQTYGDTLPYGHHLDMVVDDIRRFGYLVAVEETELLPLVFGGYYHDSIEDARQTYNDVMKAARRWMSDEQALVATEIVYALTNDKGRSREERAGERYYAGIRETPFAPFVKLCDRFANVAHSCRSKDANNQRMKGIYSKEMPHFLSNIVPPSDDPRRQVPQVVVDEMMGLLQNG
jgi:hypothetical protein